MKPSTPLLLRPLQWIYVIYAFATFIALMIPVFLWSLLAMLAGPLRRGNLVYRGCTAWADTWYLLIGIRHRNLREPSALDARSCIYVCNHNSYMDIPCIVKTFRQPVRPLGKAEMARVPIFGFIYRNAIVTVDRSSPENRARSVRQLKGLLQQGLSVLVFPEGTFNETGQPLKSLYDGAFRIALETGAPIRPVLMLDNHDRLHYRSLFTLTPGRSRSVFLDPIPTQGRPLSDLPALKEEVRQVMERELQVFQASWIGEQPGQDRSGTALPR